VKNSNESNSHQQKPIKQIASIQENVVQLLKEMLISISCLFLSMVYLGRKPTIAQPSLDSSKWARFTTTAKIPSTSQYTL
jgi:hypothetical protein